MIRYTIRRFLEMLLILFIIATATFFLLEAIPGNPLMQKVERLPENVKEAMYEKYGYNKPVGERYMKTMNGILHGDFGESIVFPGQTVGSILKEKLPASARLGIQEVIVGLSLGIILGILAAMNRGTWIDRTIVTIAILFISVPSFIFALGLQKIFAGNLKWFPIIGWPRGKDAWFGGWKYTVLPTLSGCFGYIASYSRLLKTSMLDVINQDYVLTARSKGLSNAKVVTRHILRNSFIPLVTYLPMTLAFCITGAFFIERVFSIPGLGLYYITAVQAQDLPMVMGHTIIITAMYVVCIFITDILYTVVDPRIRISGGKR
ncbi:ABC transporter permease [uncultured Clostridium sp.]|uniref:ABC transporter permease n=1 Tax=uncultured Clostridium sp. TaxID=59620 RepID=UPI002583F697|nr:ABC transporter permease [uncultured Clostridium sp.]MDU1349771.1 ABC transporter permease [Clostridium argentinense]